MPQLREHLQSALGGAYRLDRELGGGAMSRVFVAEETALGRLVVIKLLSPGLAAEVNSDRFRREIQLAAGLQHPHIVPLLSAGEIPDLYGPGRPAPYYTMPFVKGESLETRLRRHGELPIGEAARVLRDVADALSCAHGEGVLHRDIKPANVLLSGHPPHERGAAGGCHAMVTDFGVAKAIESGAGGTGVEMTATGFALGTPAYMAPEQAAGDPATDHRADIYAFGVLAYEALTGRLPFAGSTPQQILIHKMSGPIEPLGAVRSAIPPALAAMVMRCLEIRPADRWQRAEEILRQLETGSVGMEATPSAGTAPVQTGTVSSPAAAVLSRATHSREWHRAGYLTLGIALALGLAWGVSRYRGGRPETADTARTIAVLPFENLGRPEDAYFADGITEEITNRLTGIGRLKVIARSSAKQYKGTQKPLRQIGEELGVGYVLEGTVRWEKGSDTAGRVRVSPELIRVADGTNVWAHGYDAVMAGVFQVQSDIAEQVAGALNVALAAPEREALASRPTTSTEAYDYYLQGRAYLERNSGDRNYEAAEELLERAVALDSAFALAYAELALVHDFTYWFYFDRSERRLELSRQAADQALRLQPNLPEGHIAMAYHYYHGQLDYDRALAELELARRIRPRDADVLSLLGAIQRRQGKWQAAVQSFAQVVELDPRSARGYFDEAFTNLALGRYDDAEKWARRVIAIAPDAPLAYADLAMVYLARDGDPGKAREALVAGWRLADRSFLVRVVVAMGIKDAIIQALNADELTQLQALSSGPSLDDRSMQYEWRAALYASQHRPAEQRIYLDSTRVLLDSLVAVRPREHMYHARLGQVYAALNRRGEALREAEAAGRLMPPSKDALDGWMVVYLVARIHAMLGDKSAAIEELGRLLAVPHLPPISPAWLRVDRLWDPLRGDPRFQQLLAGR